MHLSPQLKQQSVQVIRSAASEVFSPVIPLFVQCSAEEMESGDESESEGGISGLPSVCVSKGAVTLSASTTKTFLQEQDRSLHRAQKIVSQMFCNAGDGGGVCDEVFTTAEAVLVINLLHLQDLSGSIISSVLYVETLLHRQLSAAIGKELIPRDLQEYMTVHNQKLFLPAYRPRQLSYAVRRSSSHSPEGRVSVVGGDADGSPVHVVSRGITFGEITNRSEGGDAVTLPLDATTEVVMTGERFVHAHLQHVFSDAVQNRGTGGSALTLIAQARQFSSFLLLIGRVPSSTSFDPQFAIIVKNKDELQIPLDMAVIPSVKEFKDAIRSLSPEQQQFAKAFRTLQLQSTLFGVCVIQIKPHMERVLNLPPDSLTKEIELTESLMELFVRYQIPPDMLSREGGVEGVEGSEKAISAKALAIDEVKRNVAAIQVMWVSLVRLPVYIVNE